MKILVGYLSEEYLTHDRKRFDVRYAPRDRNGLLYPLSIEEMLEGCPPGWVPDVFLHPGIGHFPLPDDIEAFPGLLACTIGDWDRRGRATHAALGFFDLAMGQQNLLPLLKAEGFENAEFVRLWYGEPEKQRILPEIERDIDLLFVGSINSIIWGKREVWLDRIAQLSDQYTVKIVSGVYDEDYVRLLNRAKIVFNCSVDGATNARVYEAALCGALLFNEAENAEVAEMFTDGVHHVAYTETNFEERLNFFLTHDEERERIAEAGRQKVRGEHTMRHHTDEMFEKIGGHLSDRLRPSAELPKWERLYRKALQVYGCFRIEYLPYCRELLRQSLREGLPPGFFHEAQASLFAWEATENEGERAGLLEAAYEQAKRALVEMPHNLFARMTEAGILLTQANFRGGTQEKAIRSLLELIERCQALLSGREEFDFTMIQGFGFPRWADGFDYRIGKAEMWLTSRLETSVISIVEQFGWRSATMLQKLALSQNQFRDAGEHGNQALQFFRDPSTELETARCLSEIGEWEAAVKLYRSGLEGSPFSAASWCPAIKAYRQTGRETEANAFLVARLKTVDAVSALAEMKPELRDLQGSENPEERN